MKDSFEPRKPQTSSFSSFPPNSVRRKTFASSFAFDLPIRHAALLVCLALSVAVTVFFLLLVAPLVLLRADILMWGETEFIGNIIKLNTGAPLYTNPSDGNSMIYNPAAFLLTYAIAWLFGLTKSVAGLRSIQLVYVLLAALAATLCSFKLTRIAFPGHVFEHRKTWSLFVFFSLFLAATAPYANQFVYTLHVDALALLISVVGFWTMLRYAEENSLKNLLLMALIPALGFLTKQFLISWAVIMLVFLFVLRPGDFKRLAVFAAVAGSLVVLSIVLCYLLWGDNYLFWAFEVMGGERKKLVLATDGFSISLVRGFDHLLRAWMAIAVGIFGCWLLIRRRSGNSGGESALRALAIAWLLLVLSEALSSGAGWGVLYHFGPGVLIGASFMFAALPKFWTFTGGERSRQRLTFHNLGEAFVFIAIVAGIYTAWGVMPSGDSDQHRYLKAVRYSPDVERYIAEIENEFDEMPAEKVLLGAGNWIYLQRDVLQKDRAVSLNDQAPGGIYRNFEVTVDRIREHAYDKIILQNFDTPFFLYDWGSWEKSSGVRSAVLEHYTKVKVIEPPRGYPDPQSQILLANPVSVFVPRK